MKFYTEKKKAVALMASYEGYHGGNWQEDFFKLLTWKNTLSSRFYELTINAHHNHSPYVYAVVPEEHAEWLKGLMEEYGYTVKAEPLTVALVEPEYEEGVDGHYIEY